MDANPEAMAAAAATGVDRVELYTEPYAAAWGKPQLKTELERLKATAKAAVAAGLAVNAGHDLNLRNTPLLAHPALRLAGWFGGEVTWFDDRGAVATGAYMDDASKPVLAWRLASGGDTLYVAYNRGTAQVSLVLPPPPAGTAWYLAADTGAWFEPKDNFNAPGAETKMSLQYALGARSVALFLAR
jgi:hypothetical protein